MFVDDRSTWPRRDAPPPPPPAPQSRRARRPTRGRLGDAPLLLLLTPPIVGCAVDLIRFLLALTGG